MVCSWDAPGLLWDALGLPWNALGVLWGALGLCWGAVGLLLGALGCPGQMWLEYRAYAQNVALGNLHDWPAGPAGPASPAGPAEMVSRSAARTPLPHALGVRIT